METGLFDSSFYSSLGCVVAFCCAKLAKLGSLDVHPEALVTSPRDLDQAELWMLMRSLHNVLQVTLVVMDGDGW